MLPSPLGMISWPILLFAFCLTSRDYPDFYTKLYQLVDGNIFHVRHRARFFKLLDLFLTST